MFEMGQRRSKKRGKCCREGPAVVRDECSETWCNMGDLLLLDPAPIYGQRTCAVVLTGKTNPSTNPGLVCMNFAGVF